MRNQLLTLVLGCGLVFWATPSVLAQTDSTGTGKPVLITTPPQAPAPAPTATPVQPEPTPQAASEPATDPTPQDISKAASGSEAPARRFFLYSNFGLGFSSNPNVGSQFSLSLAPAIGVRLTNKFAMGPGISYAYNNLGLQDQYVRQGFPKNISTNSFGLKVFAQYIVYKEFFAHAEYEVTFAEIVPESVPLGGPYTIKRTVQTPLLGIGYRQSLGERAAGDITLLYNFNDGLNDIYGQPVIRFSFLFDIK